MVRMFARRAKFLFLARSVSEGDHQPTRARNEREAEAYRGSRCPRCWGDNEPSWSPSLTLFEVALFIDFRDVRATYWLPSPPRAIVSGIFFGYRGVGAASGLNSNCAVRKCTRAPGKMMCASRLAHARRDLDCSAIRSTCLQLSSALHARLCFCDLVRMDGRVREELA